MRGRTDLDYAVEISDVDAELEAGGRDDDGDAGFGEGCFRLAAFGGGQRRVGEEGAHAALTQCGAEFFGAAAGVDEHQALPPGEGTRSRLLRW